MRVVPIKEAIALDYGESIPSFRAKITGVVEPSEGTNDHGPWTIQNITICDPADPKASIKCKLWDQPAIPLNWKGRVIIASSGLDKKGKLTGIALVQDTYKWKEGQPEKRMIEIKKDAEIVLDEGKQEARQESKQPAQQRQQTQQRPNSEPTAQEPASTKGAAPTQQQATQATDRATTTQHEPPPKKTREQIIAEDRQSKREAINRAAKYTARMVNGFRTIFRALDKFVEERAAMNKPLTESQVQGLLAQLFIGGDRKSMWDNLPTKREELEELWPQPKASPAPEDNGND